MNARSIINCLNHLNLSKQYYNGLLTEATYYGIFKETNKMRGNQVFLKAVVYTEDTVGDLYFDYLESKFISNNINVTFLFS